MAIHTNPDFAVGPIPECQLSCQNGGYCSYTDDIETFANGGMIELCICLPGFSGLACENTVEQCHDDLKCHNGAPCSLKDGQYVCDCSEADCVSNFAGRMCREPATSYCGQGGLSNRSFCTNGGLCKANFYGADSLEDFDSIYSTHRGCRCPPEFEGPHCEYLKGMKSGDAVELHLKTSMESTTKAQLAAPTYPMKDGVDAKTVLTTPITSTQGSESMSSQGSSIFANVAIVVGVAMSLLSVAVLTQYRRRFRRSRSHRDMINRASYVDQTPIRVQEERLENGYVDDEDMHSPVSECSLEEIELESNDLANHYREYLQGIRDGGFATYFDNIPDFTTIMAGRSDEEQLNFE